MCSGVARVSGGEFSQMQVPSPKLVRKPHNLNPTPKISIFLLMCCGFYLPGFMTFKLGNSELLACVIHELAGNLG